MLNAKSNKFHWSEMLVINLVIWSSIIGVLIWSGYVLSVMWGWFLVPLGVQPINTFHSVGLTMIAFLLLRNIAKVQSNINFEEKEGLWTRVFEWVMTQFIIPLAFLSIAWVVHKLMFVSAHVVAEATP